MSSQRTTRSSTRSTLRGTTSDDQPPTRDRRRVESLATASSHPRALALIRPPSPPIPDDIRELHRLAQACNKRETKMVVGHVELLEHLQRVLDHHHPGLMNVCPKPICWKDEADETREGSIYKGFGWNWDGTMTLKRWLDKDSAGGKKFSMAMMLTPSTHSAQRSHEEKRDLPFHIWLLMTAHAPPGHNGKAIITFDSDVEQHHNDGREGHALGMEYSYVEYIRKNRNGRRQNNRVWQNHPIEGDREEWDCHARVLEYLCHLGQHGLESTWGSHGLDYLDGFKMLQL
ncbi:hypothetical protein K438DRAFT_1937924 [Mycena galopus ATCC 62051]|nr:hypothetical protein K438DRAFT_1937924 [Mycena galopus ATCC 62051]